MRSQGYRWPQGMWERADAMLKSGKTYKDVAEELRIPILSLRNKAKWEQMSPERRARKRDKAREYRGYYLREIKPKRAYEPLHTPPRLQFAIERPAHKPSEKLIADRDYRLSLPPRDLTAALLGDPPPGYSALERRA